jgi:hypothetical protein
MEKHEGVVSILSKLDLDDIEQTIREPYHQSGPGNPILKECWYLKRIRKSSPKHNRLGYKISNYSGSKKRKPGVWECPCLMFYYLAG